MIKARQFLSVLWSLFWRACVYATLLLPLWVIGMAVFLGAPFYAACSFFWAPWWQGALFLAIWFALILIVRRLLQRRRFRSVNRYRDGAI